MPSADELITHVEKSFQNAEQGISKITLGILDIEGMTGKNTRHFYNNLLAIDDARYLEIGTWKGSSVCAAMCMNRASVVCIDDWSEFGAGARDDFIKNFTTFQGDNLAMFIEQDCFQVDVSQLPMFNIYLYDGNHSKESQYKALLHYYSRLDDVFVFIVDDWNWKDVREGTEESIKKLNLTVLYEKSVRTTLDESHPVMGSEAQQRWHNGIYISVLQKPK